MTVEIDGLQGQMLDSARANLGLEQYEDRDVSPAQVHRLFARADDQLRTALEPFGYYHARVNARLERAEKDTFHAVFVVEPGEPVIVQSMQVEVSPQAAQLDTIRQALERFEPRTGDRLDHVAYERSKQEIATALANEGFLGAQLVRRRIEVVRAANSAEIDLAWDAGERHRLGPVHFSRAQFPERFLQRYQAWREGEFYTAQRLLALQQLLVDTDYFSSVAVTPDLEHIEDGVVPIDALVIPAKRTVYSGSLYISTDSGPGGRIGVERRWLNNRGHKLRVQTEYSPRLQETSVNYSIPKPALANRMLNFGVGYRDEETDTSTSRMLRLAATQVTDRWRGFTRTIGLQYLNGDFEIADLQHSTNLLYAEGLLTRRKVDDVYFPLSGYTLLYGLRFAEESLLSDTSFAQARVEAKGLRRVGRDGRVIARAAFGAMVVDEFQTLPPELRFFAGGDRSIRGFDYQQIGELDARGGVIGGEYLAVASMEYEHYFLEKWGAAVFVDAGDAFTAGFEANVGTGMGLRWKSPVGLVRLDIAHAVVSDFERSWRVHLVIGPDL